MLWGVAQLLITLAQLGIDPARPVGRIIQPRADAFQQGQGLRPLLLVDRHAGIQISQEQGIDVVACRQLGDARGGVREPALVDVELGQQQSQRVLAGQSGEGPFQEADGLIAPAGLHL